MSRIPTIDLAHGAKIPRIGLGTWPMNDVVAEVVVADAIGAGYRLVDTAYAYGNERGVGRGLRASGVPRDELFVTSKFDVQWHGYREVQDAFTASIERLGLDYLDLFLIHWPNPGRDRYVDAWRGLAKLLEDGHLRAIGTSNFKPAHLDRLLAETGVSPDVNQIQLNPTLTRDAARRYNAERGIVVESWAPIGAGSELLAHPAIGKVAEETGKTPAQVVLRWHVELGLVPIPKSVSPERLRENVDIFDFELTVAQVSAISALDRGEAAAVDSDTYGH